MVEGWHRTERQARFWWWFGNGAIAGCGIFTRFA